ncbi:MAG: 30S ribosomal protein S24e [Candidatus Nanoarchaeia archaeon]
MELKIKKERETPLLSRKRVTAMISFKGATPARKELRAVVAKKLKADEKLTIIKHVYQRYGQNAAKVIAHVYSKEEDMKAVEQDYLLKKHVEKEAPAEKPAEAKRVEAAPAKVAEKPAETPKEKKHAEEKVEKAE